MNFKDKLKVLSEEQHELAAIQQYDFDRPQAFDFELLYETLRRLRVGKSVEVCSKFSIVLSKIT